MSTVFRHVATLAAVVLAATVPALAQETEDGVFEKNGVSMKIDAPKSASPGDSIEIEVTLTVPDGFHIYGSRDQIMPTKLSFEANDDVAISEAKVPGGIRHAKGGAVNYWLEGIQTIKTTATVADSASGELAVKGTLSFMVCDANSCRPPAKLPFDLAIAIESKAEPTVESADSMFEKPVRIKAAGEPVSVEEPGYAAPCLADVNGDGIEDLLVGQFNDGKIKVYPGTKQGEFGKGQWLEADGKVAEVPGVW